MTEPKDCDVTLDKVTAEITKAFEGKQSDTDALVAIDEIVGSAEGHEPREEALSASALDAVRRELFTPPDGGPDDAPPAEQLAAGGD